MQIASFPANRNHRPGYSRWFSAIASTAVNSNQELLTPMCELMLTSYLHKNNSFLASVSVIWVAVVKDCDKFPHILRIRSRISAICGYFATNSKLQANCFAIWQTSQLIYNIQTTMNARIKRQIIDQQPKLNPNPRESFQGQP